MVDVYTGMLITIHHLADIIAHQGAILSEVDARPHGPSTDTSCRVQSRPTLAELMSKNSQARSELQSFKEQLMASMKLDSKPSSAPLADAPAPTESAAAKPREVGALLLPANTRGSSEGRSAKSPSSSCDCVRIQRERVLIASEREAQLHETMMVAFCALLIF